MTGDVIVMGMEKNNILPLICCRMVFSASKSVKALRSYDHLNYACTLCNGILERYTESERGRSVTQAECVRGECARVLKISAL